MTATDQPTTEPSAVERVLAYMNEWYVDFESVLSEIPEGRRAEHLAEIVTLAQAAPAPQPAAEPCDGSGRCTARLHVHGCFADLDGHCDDPDDHVGTQPAADTETEVQWGVRFPDGEERPCDDEDQARAIARYWMDRAVEGGPVWTVIKHDVTRTAWEDA